MTCGYQTGNWTAKDGKSRTYHIWYPTDAPERRYRYSAGYESQVCVNGRSVGGTLPLVVFSHGDNASAIQSAYITEYLGRQGYIVAAVDHHDHDVPPLGQPEKWTEQSCFYRAEDIRALVTYMVSTWAVAPGIGIMGHSLGGYTALACCGALPSWRDSRLTACLGFSPYTDPLQAMAVQWAPVPTMLQGGTQDGPVTRTIQAVYDGLKAPRFFLVMQGANHYSWTNTLCVDFASAQECQVEVPLATDITAYARAFLDQYVKRIVNPAIAAPYPGYQYQT